MSKTKLSPKKFNQLKELFDGLNRNGHNKKEAEERENKAKEELNAEMQTWNSMK